jgi:hypothetical protein
MLTIEQRLARDPNLIKHRENAVKFNLKHFPATVNDPFHGFIEAQKYLIHPNENVARPRKGTGLLVLSNHISYNDAFGAPLNFMSAGHMLDMQLTIPVARHINLFVMGLNGYFRTGFNALPITTPDTMQSYKKPGWKQILFLAEFAHIMYFGQNIQPDESRPSFKQAWKKARKNSQNDRQGRGLDMMVKDAIETLKSGGIVFMFPQGGRRSYIWEAGKDDTAVGMMVNRALKVGVKDFGILNMGIGLAGVTDYAEHKGFNQGIMHNVSIGKLYSLAEAQADVLSQNISLDSWAFNQIGLLVPPEYHHPPSGVIFDASSQASAK